MDTRYRFELSQNYYELRGAKNVTEAEALNQLTSLKTAIFYSILQGLEDGVEKDRCQKSHHTSDLTCR